MQIRDADPLLLGPTGLPIVSPPEVAIGYPLGSVSLPAQPLHVEPDPVRALRDTLRPAFAVPTLRGGVLRWTGLLAVARRGRGSGRPRGSGAPDRAHL